MPRADAAMRIQRTPVLKYIGASLAGEREPAESEHRCSHPGNGPFLAGEGGWKGSPWLSPVPCVGSHAWLLPRGSTHTPARAQGSSSLAPYLCFWPEPRTHAHVIPWGELGKAQSCRDPEAARVPSFPKAHYVPKCKPPGVTTYSRLAEAFTFLRTMPCNP